MRYVVIQRKNLLEHLNKLKELNAKQNVTFFFVLANNTTIHEHVPNTLQIRINPTMMKKCG